MKTIDLNKIIANANIIEIPEETIRDIDGGCTYKAHVWYCGSSFLHWGVNTCSKWRASDGYCPNGYTYAPGDVTCNSNYCTTL